MPEKLYAIDSLLTFLWNPALGCCFACEINKKKVVHPSYDEYLGRREFQRDEVDCGSYFPSPLDVDYIFFDADRDRASANHLWGEIMDHWGWQWDEVWGNAVNMLELGKL